MRRCVENTLTCGVLAAISGCMAPSLVYENDRLDSRMLCTEGAKRVTLTQRYSFDLPEPFRHTVCGTLSSGFTYRKDHDALSVGTSGSFSYGTVQVTAGSLYMGVDSFLSGKGDGLLYPKEVFAKAKLAALALPGGGFQPNQADWVTRGGYQCLRFYESWRGQAVGLQEDEVKYWCWEGESGLKQPFYVHAGQRMPLGAKGYDLDQTFIQPFFQSLKINPLPVPVLVESQRKLQAICAHAKSRYDQGLPWGADYPDQRLTLTELHYCGYDVPLPDLSAPQPQAKTD
ncbi:hypothetical protein GV819_25260 [Pseudomonas sp. Fl5BN2]|nr:hypothetical protein [Pseudomonas sp. Fl5BN2]